MWIESIRVENYKRFRDTGHIALVRGMNVLVGQNDAGKTALIEALSKRGRSNMLHRSLLTVPSPGKGPYGQSRIHRTIRLDGWEIREALAPHNIVSAQTVSPAELLAVAKLNEAAEVGGALLVEEVSNSADSAWLDGMPLGNSVSIIVENTEYPSSFAGKYGGSGSSNTPYGLALLGYVQQRVYPFIAQRYNNAIGGTGTETLLAPDASNLAQVLNNLHSTNRPRFDRFMSHVREVFPHITNISIRLLDASRLQIEVWDFDMATERSDLAVSLDDSGTGVGQILAMLYVVVTSRDPRIIVIDEPHSFLHPGAVRKLFEIFASYPQHQYIITTHSPTALVASRASSLHIVRRGASDSSIASVDTESAEDLMLFLREVGARLSDVFGPDKILWCEGKTEETVFPQILRAYRPEAIVGADVLAVRHTSDIEGKHAEKILGIYQRLSTGTSVLPPAVAFILDREDRSEATQKRMQATGKGLMMFLPRKMIENYLIRPSAIAKVLNAEDTGKQKDYDSTNVDQWLAKHALSETYFAGSIPGSLSDPQFLVDVHAANLLQDMFQAVSETRVAYDKVKHGPMITRELLAENDGELKDLADWLAHIIDGSSNIPTSASAMPYSSR